MPDPCNANHRPPPDGPMVLVSAYEERTPGEFVPLHDTLRGRIFYSSERDEVAFVIDGKCLSLSQLTKIVQMYEGWEFQLDFLDEGS